MSERIYCVGDYVRRIGIGHLGIARGEITVVVARVGPDDYVLRGQTSKQGSHKSHNLEPATAEMFSTSKRRSS